MSADTLDVDLPKTSNHPPIRKQVTIGELDMTPMVDVTFLLLIFLW